MRQIYINTMLGTTRIDYREDLPGDVIISATNIGAITAVNQINIEETNVDPVDMVDNYSAHQHYVVMPISDVADEMLHAIEPQFIDGEMF